MSKTARVRRSTNPVIILMGILFLGTLMTWIVSSGVYQYDQYDQRDGRLIIPGSYEVVTKERSIQGLIVTPEVGNGIAAPVSAVQTLLAIPAGFERGAGLIFMVLIIGGMFGILDQAGVVDNGINRLLRLVKGNVSLLVVVLMAVFSAGSAFLGLASEYLIVIPVMTAMATRIGLPTIVGFAIVTLAVKIGYLASVTNPIPLTIAQPLVGVPIFSGVGLRMFFYAVFLFAGIAFMLFKLRGVSRDVELNFDELQVPPISIREALMSGVLVIGIIIIIIGSTRMQWTHHELTACYIAISIGLGACSTMSANESVEAFIGGMKKVLLASALIAVAMAVTIVLEQGQILDTIVHTLNGAIGGNGAYITAVWMFLSQLLLDFMIPSTSGQAAVTMPVLAPLGQLAGVGPQTTVSAFLFGNGITNMLTPTSGTLLAYLAAGRIEWLAWVRYILPIWAGFIVLACALLSVAVVLGV